MGLPALRNTNQSKKLNKALCEIKEGKKGERIAEILGLRWIAGGEKNLPY